MWVSEATAGETQYYLGPEVSYSPLARQTPPSESTPSATCICLDLHGFGVWRIWQGDSGSDHPRDKGPHCRERRVSSRGAGGDCRAIVTP